MHIQLELRLIVNLISVQLSSQQPQFVSRSIARRSAIGRKDRVPPAILHFEEGCVRIHKLFVGVDL